MATPFLGLLLIGASLGNGGTLQAAPAPRQTIKPADRVARNVNLWIKRLASDDPAMRQRATNELAKIGKAALPALKKEANHKNADVRRSVRDLVARLEPKPRIIKINVDGMPIVIQDIEIGNIPIGDIEIIPNPPPS
jgi:hypothetical protein